MSRFAAIKSEKAKPAAAVEPSLDRSDAPPAPAKAPAPGPIVGPTANFDYRIEGRGRPRPEAVWDDGQRTYFAFKAASGLAALPPLFRVDREAKRAELINYRVEGRTLVVDGLVDQVEFRLGRGRGAERVRITRSVRLGGGRP